MAKVGWDFYKHGCENCHSRRLTMSKAANIVVDKTNGVWPPCVTLTCRCGQQYLFRFSDGAVMRKHKPVSAECR